MMLLVRDVWIGGLMNGRTLNWKKLERDAPVT